MFSIPSLAQDSWSGEVRPRLSSHRQSHDGDHLLLDMLKGGGTTSQLENRGLVSDGENMMQFASLQDGYWHSQGTSEMHVQVIAFWQLPRVFDRRTLFLSPG